MCECPDVGISRFKHAVIASCVYVLGVGEMSSGAKCKQR